MAYTTDKKVFPQIDTKNRVYVCVCVYWAREEKVIFERGNQFFIREKIETN